MELNNDHTNDHTNLNARKQVRVFMQNIRPLDLLVFRGNGTVSDIINLAQDITCDGDNSITHVEVAITRRVCPKIKKLVVDVIDTDETMLSWGSTTMSHGVLNAETGKPTCGVQIRVLEDLLLKYFLSPHANVGVCRLINNPCETMDADALAHRMSVCYAATHKRRYNSNPAALIGSMIPALRPVRDLTQDIMSACGVKWLFCSELAAHIYIAAGVITDATDGTIDGKILNPADVVPSDFLGGDADSGLVNRICNDPIWLKDM